MLLNQSVDTNKLRECESLALSLLIAFGLIVRQHDQCFDTL